MGAIDPHFAQTVARYFGKRCREEMSVIVNLIRAGVALSWSSKSRWQLQRRDRQAQRTPTAARLTNAERQARWQM